MNWINDNYQWFFSGLGVLIISILIAKFRKNLFPQTSTHAQSIKGNNNIQAGRNVNVNTTKQNRPRLNVRIEYQGGGSSPIKSKFQVGQTKSTKSFYKKYSIHVKNESKEYAYNCNVQMTKSDQLSKYLNSGRIGSLGPNGTHTVLMEYSEQLSLSGFQMREYSETKYSKSLIPFEVIVEYEDSDNKKYVSHLSVDKRGTEELSIS